MTILKTAGISLCLLLSANALRAQNVTISNGGQTKLWNVKGSDYVSFTAGKNNYFVTTKFDQAVMKFYLESYTATGTPLAQTPLEISGGVFNNSYGIDQVIGLGNTAYALVEHLDKPAAKNTLTARAIDNAGRVSTTEVELMSMAFEKTMNSGFNDAAVSADNNMLAVLGQLPYVKDQSAKLKIALFDKDLNKKSENEVSIPGEDTKNKRIKMAVGNDGTVYLIKQTSLKNGEMALAVYQYSGTTELKEYTFELAAPNYFNSYEYTVNESNELIISGTYYERKTVTVGDKKTMGVFFFTNKGKSEKVFKSFTLDTPVDNLTARKVLVSGNTVFLAAEQYKEEKIAPPATTGAAAFDYNYNYTHKNEYAIAMDADGNKKFEVNMAKDFVVRDFDKQYYSAYFICNGKLTVVYNDRAKKYTGGSEEYYVLPVLVQITTDGLMQSPVVFMDKLKLSEHYYMTLYPSVSVQNATNEISLLLKNGESSKHVTFKID